MTRAAGRNPEPLGTKFRPAAFATVAPLFKGAEETGNESLQATGERGRVPIEADRYRLLVEAITDYAIYMLDPGGIVSSWNPGAERSKGYTASEIIGRHFSCFYTPEDRAAGMPEKALRLAETEGRFETEGWRLRQDGSRFWSHAVIDPIWSPTGELIGFAKITRDLTERKETEAALKRSEEQFRLLVQGVTDYAIYMLDRDGNVASWNSGAQRIKGYRPEEIIGKHFSRFYTEEDQAEGWPRHGLEVAAREGRFEKEGWRVRKDGSRFWANIVIDAIRDDHGELIGFAKVTRDITEKRNVQRDLEEAREALFHAQKLEAVGQLTGGIAHDFNNLLMVILSGLAMARKRLPNDPKLIEMIDNAERAGHRGAALTQRMLAFARRQELDPAEIDLADLVTGMRELLQRSLGPSIRLETSFQPSLPKVYCDANHLETALLNLAVNARDAMPGGGSLFVGGRVCEAGQSGVAGMASGLYVCLSVTDTGDGMDEETLVRATEPFFTTKGVGKGTGLGLSMVQGLAEQSGGRLLLRSSKGKGTTAELWLPVSAGKNQEEAEVAKEQREPAAHCQRKKLRVLAVDDDALVLMNASAMLEDAGHSVIEANSGKQALQLLRSGAEVDLVLTDQAMPGMTGLELARSISSEWPDMPVILATGYAELPEDANLPRLSKPYTQAQLEQVLNETWRSRSS